MPFRAGNRGKANGSIGAYEQARNDFSQAIEMNPLYADNYFYRGMSYALMDESENAIFDFEKAVELNLPPDLEADAEGWLTQLQSTSEGLCSLDTIEAIPAEDIPTFFIEFRAPGGSMALITIFDANAGEDDEGSVLITAIPEEGFINGHILYTTEVEGEFPESYRVKISMPTLMEEAECQISVDIDWP